MAKIAMGIGCFFVVIETVFMILEGGAPFWPMWAKNYLAGAVLLSCGFIAHRSKTARNRAYLASAWGFVAGLFLVSTLATVQVGRPAEIAIALAVYTCLCLAGLFGTLKNMPD